MDWRTKNFRDKFENAMKILKAKSVQDIVSFKLRERNVYSSEYQDFIHDITSSSSLKIKPATAGNFQGRAWIVSNKLEDNLLLVEHETGLEILSLAGGICSILGIGLIPAIKYLWDRRHHRRHLLDDDGGIEVRTFDQNNKLIEQKTLSIEGYILTAQSQEIAQLRKKVEQVEKELKRLKSKEPNRRKDEPKRK